MKSFGAICRLAGASIARAIWKSPGKALARLSAALVFALFVLGTSAAQTWHTEKVDDSGHDVGEFSSVGVDGLGNVHLVYWDATGNAPRGQLVYAFRASGDKKWSHMVVDEDGTYVSLALDAANHPHIAYNSKRENGLHYAHWDGTKWHTQVIDPGHINYYLCLQVDAEGNPKISYYLYHAPTGEYSLHLKYAYSDGKQWYIQTVDPRDHTGKMNSLALDRDGNPYIAYIYVGNGAGDMFFTHWDGQRWQYSVADKKTTENNMYSMGNSIAVDRQGHAHLAYLDSYSKALKVASWDGTRWKVEKIDSVASVAHLDHPSVKIDSEDHLHIAYADGGAGILKYAAQGPKGWQVEVVDHDGNAGFHPWLALAPDGEPVISYFDSDNKAVRIARRESTPIAQANSDSK